MNAKDFFKLFKVEITLLVDLVAVAAFFSNPLFSTRVVLIAPLLVSGTLASMSAGLFNNIYDRDIDTKMDRTAYRWKLINDSNLKQFSVFSILMVAASFTISYIFINLLTALLIFSGFLAYVVLYTIVLKRRTSWNIVLGGIAGSFPALAGWSTLSDSLSITAYFIAFLVFLWTPTHFWNLATSHVEEYKKANVPMLPAVVSRTKSEFYVLLSSIILVVYSLIPLVVRSINVGILYYVFAVVMGGVIVYTAVKPLISPVSANFFKKSFGFTNFYLLILLISISLVSIVR
ncbi:MAG: heme o synthase [Thermoplasmatales archaeon]|nr:heme o synthase [Thermoplasmatales archaeon]MCW6170913.1 heme o synthase [Thermoplasmatales archaeon]